MAAAFFGAQPDIVAAVTGTKGKSSIVAFLREIWTALGKPAASLGTVGVVGPKGEMPLSHTTPDPVEIHRLLAELKKDGVDHLAIEASSHGLDQYRLDGVKIAAAGFTNITRDHMDYHATFEDYLAAKLRLFSEVVARGRRRGDQRRRRTCRRFHRRRASARLEPDHGGRERRNHPADSPREAGAMRRP